MKNSARNSHNEISKRKNKARAANRKIQERIDNFEEIEGRVEYDLRQQYRKSLHGINQFNQKVRQKQEEIEKRMQEKATEYHLKRESVLQRKLLIEEEIDKKSIEFIDDLDKKFYATTMNRSYSLQKIRNTAFKSNLKAERKLYAFLYYKLYHAHIYYSHQHKLSMEEYDKKMFDKFVDNELMLKNRISEIQK